MKIGLLLNPSAGSSDQGEAVRELIRGHEELSAFDLGAADGCSAVVRDAANQGCEIIAAAGGDGTVHDVANAILRQELPVTLGIVPLGTGNDLARTLRIGPDPRDAIAQLLLARTVRLDVMEVRVGSRTLFGINAVTGGFSGDVTDSLSAELKTTFGPLAYVIGTVTALPDLSRYHVSLAFDHTPADVLEAVAVVAANGRTVAGGKRIASFANPQDGLIDVVVVRPSTLLNLADIGARLIAGNLLGSKHVFQRRARHLHIAGEETMQFNVDGELVEGVDLEINMKPSSLPVIVGPDYEAVVPE